MTQELVLPEHNKIQDHWNSGAQEPCSQAGALLRAAGSRGRVATCAGMDVNPLNLKDSSEVVMGGLHSESQMVPCLPFLQATEGVVQGDMVQVLRLSSWATAGQHFNPSASPSSCSLGGGAVVLGV